MKIYKTTGQSIFDLLGTTKEEWEEQQKHQKISEPKQEPLTITLYRGFNYLPKPNQNGTYTFSPEKSEQQALWFTHDFINIRDNPKEYAKDHGKYFLTYPLNVIKHYQTVSYDNNNETYEIIPQEINDKTEPIENCKYYSGIELPNGWLFSYKTEKFIIATIPITVTKEMIS